LWGHPWMTSHLFVRALEKDDQGDCILLPKSLMSDTKWRKGIKILQFMWCYLRLWQCFASNFITLFSGLKDFGVRNNLFDCCFNWSVIVVVVKTVVVFVSVVFDFIAHNDRSRVMVKILVQMQFTNCTT